MAGKTLNLGAADRCVGLPTVEGSWRFNSFTVEEYEALYQKILAGEITIDAGIEAMPATVKAVVDEQN
jgi:basic membrane protein A